MERVSEPILGNQETSSQEPYHTHTLMTFRVCIGARPTTRVRLPLGDSNHLSDRTPIQKRIAIEPQNKRENTKTIEKVKKKRKKKKGFCIKISGIIQSESRAQSEGSVKA